MQVIGKELFGLLRETHGKGFQSFIDDKVVPLAGDIIHENLGVEGPQLSQMTRELNVIVNGAATTNFYERYVFILKKILLTRYCTYVYSTVFFHTVCRTGWSMLFSD
jgi:hypothetical protein